MIIFLCSLDVAWLVGTRSVGEMARPGWYSTFVQVGRTCGNIYRCFVLPSHAPSKSSIHHPSYHHSHSHWYGTVQYSVGTPGGWYCAYTHCQKRQTKHFSSGGWWSLPERQQQDPYGNGNQNGDKDHQQKVHPLTSEPSSWRMMLLLW